MSAPYVPQIALYRQWLKDTRGLSFDSYDAMWRWSTRDLDTYWRSIWDYFRIQSPEAPGAVLGRRDMPHAEWFPGAQVNYTAQIFRHVEAAHAAGRPAVITLNEKGVRRELSWPELKRQSASLALHLQAQGVQKGDRVAAYIYVSADRERRIQTHRVSPAEGVEAAKVIARALTDAITGGSR